MNGSTRKLAIASGFCPGPNGGGKEPPNISGTSEREELGAAGEGRLLARIAQAEYAARRRRDRLFDADLFAEPAWDMLLDLYVQRHHCRPVSIHSLCIAASVPQTTALRWIGKLASRGIVERRPCTYDNRVIHIALSSAGLSLMETYLRAQSGPPFASENLPASLDDRSP